MNRFILATIAATTVGCGPLQPIPANANPADQQAAAWGLANVFCTARANGVSFTAALRTAFISSEQVWGRRMYAPGFSQLAAAAIVTRCESMAKPPTSI